jgi:ABC-type multidrug transport system ATPase subunit
MSSASAVAPPVVELASASRRYGTLTALRPVTLRLDPATMCLVHGANGSGKTTLLRVCAGLLTLTTGTRHASGRCVYLRSGSGTRRRQTVHDVLFTAGALAGRTSAWVREAIDVAELTSLADRRVESLSSGQRGRLLVGLALATLPAVACLDEPTAHLDEEGVAVVRAALSRLVAAGTAVLVATHDRDLLGQTPDARLLVEDGSVRSVA